MIANTTSTRYKLVYILAASHSGSTLLSMLLGAHPDACTVGELKLTPHSLGDPESYRCSCGALLRQCPFWQQVSRNMAERGAPFNLANAGTDFRASNSPYARRLLRPMLRKPWLEGLRDLALALSPTWRREIHEIQMRNAKLVATLLELEGARTIVDSSKVAIRLKYLLRNCELEVRVIRLIRDGRAVALTYTDPARFADAREAALRGGGMGGDRSGERLPMSRAAYEWCRNNEEGEHLLASIDTSRWLEVRYEDLCTRTDETLRRIFSFLELDPARSVGDFRPAQHHVIGNGMRLDGTAEITLDDRWRDVLTTQELNTFDNVAGHMNRRYGYESDFSGRSSERRASALAAPMRQKSERRRAVARDDQATGKVRS